jgi:hypothetical protein
METIVGRRSPSDEEVGTVTGRSQPFCGPLELPRVFSRRSRVARAAYPPLDVAQRRFRSPMSRQDDQSP